MVREDSMDGSSAVALDPDDAALQELAKRITKRDQLSERVKSHWLQTGRDLLTAKEIAGHRHFQPWCAEKLNYGKRTAQKLMRAAEVLGPYIKSESDARLLPPNVVYALSASSVPKSIRDDYVPRIIAGESVRKELRAKLTEQRRQVVHGKSNATVLTAPGSAAVVTRAAVAVDRGSQDECPRVTCGRQGAAREKLLALVAARIGDDLPTMLELVATAGSASIFDAQAKNAFEELERGHASARDFVNAGTIVSEPTAAAPTSRYPSQLLEAASTAGDQPVNEVGLTPTSVQPEGVSAPTPRPSPPDVVPKPFVWASQGEIRLIPRPKKRVDGAL